MSIRYITNHARFRAAQRNMSEADINFVARYGKRIHRAGAIFCQMYPKRIPKDVAPNDRRHKLSWATVLLCSCGDSVVTVYRNRKAFKKDRAKKDYNKKEKVPCACSGCKHKT